MRDSHPYEDETALLGGTAPPAEHEGTAAVLQSLNAVATELSIVLSSDDVARAVLTHGLQAMGACAGAVMVLSDDGRRLDIVRQIGMSEAVVRPFRSMALEPGLPITDAILRREMVFMRSIEERDRMYPQFAGIHTPHRSFVAVPLLGPQGRVIGGFSLSFPQARDFDDMDRQLLGGIAQQAANALQRANIIAELEAQRSDAAFLARASERLGGSLDYDETVECVTRLCVPELADWCVVYLRDDDGQRYSRAVYSIDAEAASVAEQVEERWPVRPGDGSAIDRVIETGEPLLVREFTDETLSNLARDDEHLRLLRSLGIAAAVVAPLVVGSRHIGALSLVTTTSGRSFVERDLTLVRQLADRAAAALENALMYRRAEAQARAASALAHIDNGVILVDRDQRVVVWNPAAAAMLGVSERDVLERPASEAVPGWKVIAERVQPTLLEDSSSVHVETLPLQLPSGRELWIAISGVRFPDGTAYAFRNVSDEREIERMKSDFVATVSHELRTPLASVYGAAMTLQRPEVVGNEEMTKRLVQIIGEESERLTGIIGDVLLASRIDSGRLEMHAEIFDVGAMLRDVVDAARTRLDKPGQLELHLPAEPIEIETDRDRLRQVVVNLVENAIKYSPDGGRIDVGVQLDEDGQPRIWVCDEGLGIPSEQQGRIFEKFFRLDPNQTRGVGGTGLGLYICRELVTRMGGSINVDSELGAGSRFEIRLPRHAQPDSVPAASLV